MNNGDIVREQLRHLGPFRGGAGEAALDALVAERHELKNRLAVQQNWKTLYEREKAEVARLREALRVAVDVMREDGYDTDPDYEQEWASIMGGLGV